MSKLTENDLKFNWTIWRQQWLPRTKKRIRFENTQRRIYTVIFLSHFLGISRFLGHLHRWSHHWFQEPDMPHPEKCFLTWWPWPLTYDPDLRTWPRYSSIWPTCPNLGQYVCPFSHERGNTHTHTDRQTHDVKTITPVAYAGCKNTFEDETHLKMLSHRYKLQSCSIILSRAGQVGYPTKLQTIWAPGSDKTRGQGSFGFVHRWTKPN